MASPSERPALSSLSATEARPPSRLYHAAPRALHDSILEHGLDPARFPRERWDASDLGVWCFDTLERAAEYASSRSRGPLPEPYEVWEITAEGLEMTRPWYDPESDLPAGVDVWWLDVAVRPERLSPAMAPEPASLSH